MPDSSRLSGLPAELRPDTSQYERINAYVDLLHAWNSKINLTGGKSPEEIWRELVPDSFHLALFMGRICPEPVLILDFGAGAGLPGIPLRILSSPGEYHMIEARGKRAIFLAQALAVLKPERTYVLNCRVEDLPVKLRCADLILSRAFMKWPDYLKLAHSYLKPGGLALVMSHETGADVGLIPEGWQEADAYAYFVRSRKAFIRAYRKTDPGQPPERTACPCAQSPAGR